MNEHEHLASLPRLERRFLKNYACGWCEQRIDRGCASIYGPPCTDEQIIERRRKCIERDYRPRKGHQLSDDTKSERGKI